MPRTTAPKSARRRIGSWAAALIFGAGVAGAGAWWFSPAGALPEGVTPADYHTATRQFERINHRSAARNDVFSFLGEQAVTVERLALAADCFAEIPSDDPRYGRSARLQQAQVLLRLNRAYAAEQNFREFLTLAAAERAAEPAHIAAAARWLSYILSVELRFEDRKPVLAAMHRRGQADMLDSKQYHFPSLLIWNSPAGRRRLMEFLKADPANPQLRCAQGRYLTADGQFDAARALLEELFRQFPPRLDCAAALLECLFESHDLPEFTKVAQTLPGYAAGEPWLLTRLRGELAMQLGQAEQALAYFQHVLAADPANPLCQMGLSRAWAALHRPAERAQALNRSLVLSRIRVGLVKVNDNTYKSAAELAAECDQAGLSEAAETFRRHALQFRSASESVTDHEQP